MDDCTRRLEGVWKEVRRVQRRSQFIDTASYNQYVDRRKLYKAVQDSENFSHFKCN